MKSVLFKSNKLKHHISTKNVGRRAKPYLEHLDSRKALETSSAGIRSALAALAVETNRRAAPFIAQARALRGIFSGAGIPSNLLGLPWIYLAPTTSEELVFRFLLTRGDTLGGSMRNIGGFMAQKKLTRAVIAYLKLTKCEAQWLRNETNAWTPLSEDAADLELSLRGLSWNAGKGPRTLLYNVTVPLFGNNVDLSLFDCAAKDLTRAIIKTPSAYIALGELKGGIDPAGADERWKTARTALNRIHDAFSKLKLRPHTFFIGAAIEPRMAKEIWEMLKKGKMENAANLTDEDQIVSITSWLCAL